MIFVVQVIVTMFFVCVLMFLCFLLLFGIIPNANLLILKCLFLLQQSDKYFTDGVCYAAITVQQLAVFIAILVGKMDVVAVFNQKGGVGKSTTTVQLADGCSSGV
ncbi:ParA family protein [Iodobacter fluviatilis]|uniref:Uncharacterized protein n=1 Tax=Iodobacter fluviatilis TaxID=537 RepID=A0A7G3GG73_9NEIS|nr:AAA family ATPase [Iodobacter fluviatilis]QBC45965.1 hypothetical protein C1H71_20730 [Iodobacter fluviatilis]